MKVKTLDEKRDSLTKELLFMLLAFALMAAVQTYRVFRYENKMRAYAPCQDVTVTMQYVGAGLGSAWTASCGELQIDLPIEKDTLRIELKPLREVRR